MLSRVITSNFSKTYETRDSFSSVCSHIVLVYFQSFRRNSPLKRAPQPKIAKKNHLHPLKPLILAIQGHLRSSM